MKTEILDAVEEITITEESLEEQLLYLLVAKDETLAMIDYFGPEEHLIEKLKKIEEKIKELKELI